MNPQTLRYYERRGLLAEPERSLGGHRTYQIADLQVIATTLRAALDAGCAELTTCAATPECPLPFADLATSAADAAHR